MRRPGALAALLALACSYDFDRYAAPAGDFEGQAGEGGELARGGSAGKAGSAGAGTSAGGNAGSSSAGKGGSGGTGGKGGKGGAAGTDAGGAAGASESGEGGSDGGTTAGSAAGTAGSAGTAGAGGGGSFDCGAVSGTTWNDHCYFSVGSGDGLTFEAAAASCAMNEGAHLVTIASAEEQGAIEAAFFPSATDFWIGLALPGAPEDVPIECAIFPDACPFEWITAEELEFTDWAPREGDDEPNYSGACVRIQAADLAWADFGCTSPLLAICER